MRKHKSSSWMRNVPTERQAPTAQPKQSKSTPTRKRKARRYTVSSQGKYAQTQGTASRGPIAKAMYHYTDAHGQVWAKWNEGDAWEYCGRVARDYR